MGLSNKIIWFSVLYCDFRMDFHHHFDRFFFLLELKMNKKFENEGSTAGPLALQSNAY